MTTDKTHPHLRPVGRRPDGPSRTQIQRPLFREPRPSLVTVIDASHVKADEFVAALQDLKPRCVFDVRPVPAFEQWGTSRAAIFRQMQQTGSRYYDLAPILNIASSREARFASGALAQEIGSRYLKPTNVSGPIFIVVANQDIAQTICRTIPHYLRPAPREGWDVECLPLATRKLEGVPSPK